MNCSYDSTGCHGDASCQCSYWQTGYVYDQYGCHQSCTGCDTWNGSSCVSSCQPGCESCNGSSCVSNCLPGQSCSNYSCQDPYCDSNQCMQLDSNHYCVSNCTAQGMMCYNGSCISNCAFVTCNSDQHCDNGSCVSNCDAQCQCNNQGGYNYWDGTNCQYDSTGCHGDPSCQCSYNGGTWDGTGCNY